MDSHKMLLGELKEFRRSALAELQKCGKDIQELRKEVRSLRDFKWKLIGISSGSGAVTALLAMIIRELVRNS